MGWHNCNTLLLILNRLANYSRYVNLRTRKLVRNSRSVWGLFESEGQICRGILKIYFYWRVHFRSFRNSIANLCLQTFDLMSLFPPWRKGKMKLRSGAAPSSVTQSSVANWQNTTTVRGGICQRSMTQQPLVGHGRLIIEVSHSHSATSNTVRLLWTSDQPLTTHNTHNRLMSSPRRDSNPQSQQASCQRLHGHWDQLYVNVVNALSVKHYKIRLVCYTGVFL